VVPRAFSLDERDRIAQRLVDAGRQAFAAHGLRRVSVDELARAAGISKGAFYHFFASKEDLLLEIFQRFESDFQSRELERVLRPKNSPAESLRQLLTAAVEVRGSDPLLRRITDEDVEVLLRRVTPAQAATLRQADVASARRFLTFWREQGADIAIDEEELTGLLRAVVLVAFREQEIGPRVYPHVMALMIEAIAAHLMPSSLRPGKVRHDIPAATPTEAGLSEPGLQGQPISNVRAPAR
jgi:AcrR family transcriptional regulator